MLMDVGDVGKEVPLCQGPSGQKKFGGPKHVVSSTIPVSSS
jgi:hypothetical protein